MNPKIKFSNLLSFFKNFCLCFTAFFLILISCASFVSSVYFQRSVTAMINYGKLYFRWDNLFFNLSFTAIMLLGLWVGLVLFKKLFSFSFIGFSIFAFLLLFLFNCFVTLTFCTPAFADGAACLQTAQAFLQKDFSALEPGGYLFFYPFQIFYVFFLLLINFFFPVHYLTALHILNATAATFISLGLYLICLLLFRCKKTALLCFFLTVFCFQLTFFSSYIYSNLLGIAFAVWAIWALLKFFETTRLLFGFFSAFLCAMSIQFKNSMFIFFIASVFVLILQFFKLSAKKKTLCVLVAFFFFKWLSSFVLNIFVEQYTNHATPQGMPLSAWFAMGLHDTEDDTCVPGWWDSSSINLFEEAGYDRALTNQLAIDDISHSLSNYAAAPQKAIRFAVLKTLSVWNNPTLEAVEYIQQAYVENHQRWPYLEEHSFLSSLLSSSLYWLFFEINNIHHFLLYGFSCFFICRKRFSLDAAQFLPLLCFLGGFGYLFLSEAKTGYSLQYYLLLIPFAAAGITDFFNLLGEIWRKFHLRFGCF